MDRNPVETALRVSPAPHVISRHRRIDWCNDAFAALFGYDVPALLGSSLAPLYPTTDDFVRIGRNGLRLMRESPHYEDERMMKHRDGSVFWCRVRGVSLSAENPFALAVWNFERIGHRASQATRLTPREREIVALIGTGLTSKEIGASLGLSHRTVETHRARAMQKLDARNVAELVAQIVLPHGS